MQAFLVSTMLAHYYIMFSFLSFCWKLTIWIRNVTIYETLKQFLGTEIKSATICKEAKELSASQLLGQVVCQWFLCFIDGTQIPLLLSQYCCIYIMTQNVNMVLYVSPLPPYSAWHNFSNRNITYCPHI